jgi:hypothetical protein
VGKSVEAPCLTIQEHAVKLLTVELSVCVIENLLAEAVIAEVALPAG